MLFSKKAAALAAGFMAALSAAAIAQNPPQGRAPASAGEVLVLDELATLEWIEKADVAALREGVIESVELQIGMPVLKNGVIGKLHDEVAKLTVAKAVLAARGTATELKAVAQKELAEAIVATNMRLRRRGADLVSQEEMRKAEAEVKVAAAMQNEAIEKRALDKAEYDLAVRALEEHTIRAPFAGVVYERLKNPGESVRANEAVVRLGNLDKLRAWAFVPLEYAFRIKEGQEVDIQLRLQSSRGGHLPIEQKKFRGKISYVDPQIAPTAEAAVRIAAEFENKDHDLRPGFKALMTIYLNTENAAAARPTVGAANARIGLDR
jgi:RND family efflux transporter MFP subunit